MKVHEGIRAIDERLRAADLGDRFEIQSHFATTCPVQFQNACWSAERAVGIAQEIDCVLAMSRKIVAAAAIKFTSGFYSALGFGRNVQGAFELGRIEIGLVNLPDGTKPQLLCRRGVTATDVAFDQLSLFSTVHTGIREKQIGQPSGLNITYVPPDSRADDHDDKRLKAGISTRTKAHCTRGSQQNRGTTPGLLYGIPPRTGTAAGFGWLDTTGCTASVPTEP